MTQQNESSSERPPKLTVPPLTDSIWFWGTIFATAAICALILADIKYPYRQSQLENQFLARQKAGQTASGDQGTIAPSTHERTIISLRPLFLISYLLLGVAWTLLFVQRRRLAKRLREASK